MKTQKIPYLILGLVAAVCGIYAYFNYENLSLGFSFMLGAMFAPYIFRKVSEQTTHRYLPLVILCGLVLIFRRSSSLYYALACFSLLYVLESKWGKLNQLPFFLLAAISAFVGHIAYVWSFPIRLKMSSIATQALTFIGYPVEAEGNLIIFNGQKFSVDPACMGLHMLVTSLVLGLLILAYFERKKGRAFSFIQVGLAMLTVLIFALFANFTRLLALIIFHILPENPMHDIIGLASILVYVILPFYGLIYWLNKRSKTPLPDNLSSVLLKANIVNRTSNTQMYFILTLIPYIFLIFTGIQFTKKITPQDVALQTVQLVGFQNSIDNNGVLKLKNEEAIIYIKPPVKAFQGSHDPRICWRGSGYEFTQIKSTFIYNQEVYTAILQKEDTQLYSAWWFDNGQKRTIDEWDWRWSTLSGNGDFRLVNIATAEEQKLSEVVREVLEKQLW